MWKPHPFRLAFMLRLKAAIPGAHYKWRELTREGLKGGGGGAETVLGGHMIHSREASWVWGVSGPIENFLQEKHLQGLQ